MPHDPSTDPAPADAPQGTLFPATPGERLRLAREERGLTLADIAAQTRISLKHLEGIEKSDYSTLPSLTYAIGFARGYARAVGLDEVAIARDVRARSHETPTAPLRAPTEEYDLADVRRGPGRGVVIGALLVAVLLVIAAVIHFGTGWSGGGTAQDVVATEPTDATGPAVAAAPAPSLAPAAAGQVTLTATNEVWLKVADVTGTLFQGTLHAGDHYDVPATAQQPKLTVGRPDQLTVTLNGSQLPPLGDGRRALSDLPIDPASLTARARGQPAPTPTASPAAAATPPPAARPAPRPSARTMPRPAPTRAAPAPAPGAAVPAAAPSPAATAG